MLGNTNIKGWVKEGGAEEETENKQSRSEGRNQENDLIEDKREKVSERQPLVNNCCMLSSFFFQLDKQLQCISQPPFQAVYGQWNE